MLVKTYRLVGIRPCCGQFDVAQFGEQLSTEIWTPVFGPPGRRCCLESPTTNFQITIM